MTMTIPKLLTVGALIKALSRFPAGSHVDLMRLLVYTRRKYEGERCFDLFAKKRDLPDWSKPDRRSLTQIQE